jgi:lipopolysaccharide transport system permease protein
MSYDRSARDRAGDVIELREDTVSSGIETLAAEIPPAPVAPAPAPPATEPPLTVIERRPGWQVVDLGELWRYRELLFFLVWRDIKVRYKQTVLGAAWAVLQPLATMVVFSLFLGRNGGVPSGDVPYPLFAFAGLLPWFFFANAVSAAAQSVVGSQNLVTKVYFPRLYIPLGAAGASLVDFAIAFVMLLAMMLGYLCLAPEAAPVTSWGLLLVPLIVVTLAAAAFALGILLSALTVNYRDFRHVVPFLVQLWMFATPSVYMRADLALGPRWQALLLLNPIHGLIAAFRQAMFGGPVNAGELAVAAAMSVALLVVGCLYFRRVERGFADVI